MRNALKQVQTIRSNTEQNDLRKNGRGFDKITVVTKLLTHHVETLKADIIIMFYES